MVLDVKKITVRKMLIISYIIVSALFIIMSMVNYMKGVVYNTGVQNGISTAITQVMQKAVDPKCEAFSLFSGENEVGLVNVKCLQQPAEKQVQQPAPVQIQDKSELQ